MREIAEETHLSITTISRALRKQGELSEETRGRVLEAAKRLRYRPNLLVHGIQTGRTFTMGVMVPPFDSYWTKVLYGIHDELAAADYVCMNTWCAAANGADSYSRMLLKQLHRLIDRRVDGIILWAHLAPLYSENVVEELEARDLPVVTIDHELPFADSVETNEESGGSLVAKHLLKLGHRRVAHLAWDESYKWAQLRRTYFEKVITEAGGTCITKSTQSDSEVGRLTQELLSVRPRPTAIYACSDRVASIIYETVDDMGLRIPEDISVVGFADLEFARWLRPGLTTIRQHAAEAGRTAAQLLVQRSEGTLKDKEPQRLHIECELVERGSTGPVAEGI